MEAEGLGICRDNQVEEDAKEGGPFKPKAPKAIKDVSDGHTEVRRDVLPNKHLWSRDALHLQVGISFLPVFFLWVRVVRKGFSNPPGVPSVIPFSPYNPL